MRGRDGRRIAPMRGFRHRFVVAPDEKREGSDRDVSGPKRQIQRFGPDAQESGGELPFEPLIDQGNRLRDAIERDEATKARPL